MKGGGPMTKIEYTQRVLFALRRVTKAEREAIQAEIDGHMEDHICALLDLGYSPELAEERTMSFMGDPEEVGRELNRQYPLGWLILSRAAMALTAVLLALALLGIRAGGLGPVWWSIEAHIAPNETLSNIAAPEAVARPDIRVPVKNDILRVYRVAVGQLEGQRVAELAMCVYDHIPGGIGAEGLIHGLDLEDQRGNTAPRTAHGGKSCYGTAYLDRCVPVKPGDTYVTLRYERFGERISVQIPLPEEGRQ